MLDGQKSRPIRIITGKTSRRPGRNRNLSFKDELTVLDLKGKVAGYKYEDESEQSLKRPGYEPV